MAGESQSLKVAKSQRGSGPCSFETLRLCDFATLLSRLKPVPIPNHRLNPILPDLFAEVADVGVDRSGLDVFGDLPDFGEDAVARHDGGAVADQHPEQLQLFLGQLHFLAFDIDAQRAAVDAELAVVVDGGVGLGAAGAPEDGGD